MSMKVTQLCTYWTASEAHAVIEFLDILRDQLWEQYDKQIIDSIISENLEGDCPDQLPLPGVEEF